MKKLYIFLLLFSVGMQAQPGNLCTNPIVITSLPYTTTDNTANYGDNYDPQTTTHPTCSTTTFGNYYHGGNDVIYSYTPSSNGQLKFELPNSVAWTGMFIYTDCANIGINYAACATGASAGTRTINNFSVTAGQTYYIFLSSWPTPQTFAYTLNVTDVTLGNNQISNQKAVNIYPNPVTNKLYIETETAIEKATIISVNGQRLQAIIENNQINVESLSTGFYILEINAVDGSKTFKNFIKSSR